RGVAGPDRQGEARAARGRFRRESGAAIAACVGVRHWGRPRSVVQLRPMLLGEKPQEKREPEPVAKARKPTSRPPQSPKLSGLAPRPRPARRWPAVAAGLLALLGGAYAGLEYMRWQPTAPRATRVNSPPANVAARQQADLEAERHRPDEAAAVARRQAELEAEQRRQDEAAARRGRLEAARRRPDGAAPAARAPAE